jgi:hypothetical protein
MVYGEGFQSLVTHDSTASEKIYMDLYNSASWLHSSPYADAMEEYHYDSFWMTPSMDPSPEVNA